MVSSSPGTVSKRSIFFLTHLYRRALKPVAPVGVSNLRPPVNVNSKFGATYRAAASGSGIIWVSRYTRTISVSLAASALFLVPLMRILPPTYPFDWHHSWMKGEHG